MGGILCIIYLKHFLEIHCYFGHSLVWTVGILFHLTDPCSKFAPVHICYVLSRAFPDCYHELYREVCGRFPHKCQKYIVIYVNLLMLTSITNTFDFMKYPSSTAL